MKKVREGRRAANILRNAQCGWQSYDTEWYFNYGSISATCQFREHRCGVGPWLSGNVELSTQAPDPTYALG